jgi:hypothetical protein
METWVLVIMVYIHRQGSVAVSVESVPGFKSEASCKVAESLVASEFKSGITDTFCTKQ